jgi:O-antigen ligase
LRYKIGYGLSGVALYFTGGRAALVAYIMGFSFWLFFNNKRLMSICLLVLFLVGGVFAYKQGKLYDPHRIEVWKESLTIWREKSITGHGHGSYRALVQPRLPPRIQKDGHWAQAHNEYVQILFEQGIIGLGIILSLMLITFYRFWKERKGLIPVTSLVIVSIISFYGFPFRTSMGILALIALVLFENSFHRPKCSES